MTTIERLRALLGEATPGPWVVQTTGDNDRPRVFIDTHAYAEGPEPVVAETYPLGRPDAALIAGALNALPALLAVVEAVRAYWTSLTSDAHPGIPHDRDLHTAALHDTTCLGMNTDDCAACAGQQYGTAEVLTTALAALDAQEEAAP